MKKTTYIRPCIEIVKPERLCRNANGRPDGQLPSQSNLNQTSDFGGKETDLLDASDGYPRNFSIWED